MVPMVLTGDLQAQQKPPQFPNMTFFITSTSGPSGADFGGIEGADRHCQTLAAKAGAGNKTWRAYLSTHVTAQGRPTRAVFAGPGPLEGAIRARAEALCVQVPENAAPRSIGLQPIETQASLARADELGLVRTGLRVIDAQDCDAFGRMRTEAFMHRLSDGIPHFFAGRRPGTGEPDRKVGGAALEYRLIHHAWPRAGDRLELRSGSAGGDARFRQCPKCGQASVVRQEGCDVCVSCAYSKCG